MQGVFAGDFGKASSGNPINIKCVKFAINKSKCTVTKLSFVSKFINALFKGSSYHPQLRMSY